MYMPFSKCVSLISVSQNPQKPVFLGMSRKRVKFDEKRRLDPLRLDRFPWKRPKQLFSFFIWEWHKYPGISVLSILKYVIFSGYVYPKFGDFWDGFSDFPGFRPDPRRAERSPKREKCKNCTFRCTKTVLTRKLRVFVCFGCFGAVLELFGAVLVKKGHFIRRYPLILNRWSNSRTLYGCLRWYIAVVLEQL